MMRLRASRSSVDGASSQNSVNDRCQRVIASSMEAAARVGANADAEAVAGTASEAEVPKPTVASATADSEATRTSATSAFRSALRWPAVIPQCRVERRSGSPMRRYELSCSSVPREMRS